MTKLEQYQEYCAETGHPDSVSSFTMWVELEAVKEQSSARIAELEQNAQLEIDRLNAQIKKRDTTIEELRRKLAEQQAAEEAQQCHPAACRDEMLWRKELQAAEARIAQKDAALLVASDFMPTAPCRCESNNRAVEQVESALSITSESSAKFLAGVQADALEDAALKIQNQSFLTAQWLRSLASELRGGGK
jgi:hypothetical protein